MPPSMIGWSNPKLAIVLPAIQCREFPDVGRSHPVSIIRRNRFIMSFGSITE